MTTIEERTTLNEAHIAEIRTHFATKADLKALETRLLWPIFSGAGTAPFGVRDGDMTLTYDGNPALEAGTYEFDLTVSGDADLANRTIIGKMQVTVTATTNTPRTTSTTQ